MVNFGKFIIFNDYVVNRKQNVKDIDLDADLDLPVKIPNSNTVNA